MPLCCLVPGGHSASVVQERLPLEISRAGQGSPLYQQQEPGVQLEGVLEFPSCSDRRGAKSMGRPDSGPGVVWAPRGESGFEPKAPESLGRCQTPQFTLKQPGNGKAQSLLALRPLCQPWQGSHPPPTVRLSQVEFKRFIGFFGSCPAPHAPAFCIRSRHLHCCFPSPWKCLSPPRFIRHRPASGLSVGGPETLLACP